MENFGLRLAALRSLNISQNKVEKSPFIMPDSWHKLAEFVYSRKREFPNPLYGAQFDGLLSGDQENFIFLDLETTGLSGGAGTTIFLAGFGRPKGKNLIIEQVFLSDFPGEADFFEYCKTLIGPNTTVISYNGKSFDMPLLRSKAGMFGAHIMPREHFDLLYPSRRLWKEIIGSCALSDIERQILNIKRNIDIPGYLVPERYFSFLRNNDIKLLYEVFEHHFQDILSLALILGIVRDQIMGESNLPSDLFGRAILAMRTNKDKGVDLLNKLFIKGHAKASKFLGLYYKRQNDLKNEKRIWEKFWLDNKDFFAGIELSKILEHRLKDYKAALSLLNEMFLIFAEQCERNEINYRINRIERKKLSIKI